MTNNDMTQQILAITVLLVLSACNHPQKVEVTLTDEQREFCINTFKLYLDKERAEISQEFLKLLSKHSDMNNTEEWYQANLAHIDSVMHCCINLVEQEENKRLLNVL